MRDPLGPVHCAVIRALATPGPEQTFHEGEHTARYVPEMTIRVPEDAQIRMPRSVGRGEHPLAGSTITFWPEGTDERV